MFVTINSKPSVSAGRVNGLPLLFVFGLVCQLLVAANLPIIITWDSAHYLSLSSILSNSGLWKNWDNVRGVTMPLLLLLTQKVPFIGDYGGYKLFILAANVVFIALALKFLCGKDGFNVRAGKFYLLLMLFNPFLLGYQNTMLTEFSAIILWLIAITMLCSAFSSQQISVLCSVLFGLLLSLMYLLKQQYIIFPVTLLVLLVLCFRNIRLKQRLAFLIFSLIVFGVVTHSWNLFLDQHHAIKAERALSGVIFFQLTRVTPQATVLTSQSGSSCVEEVTLQPQAVPYRFDCTTGYELERTLPFIGTMYLENLWLILSSYFNNLLGIMAFSEIGVFSFEDYSIAMRTYNVGYSLSNIFHLSEQLWPYAQPYQVKEGANGYIVKLFLALAPLYRLFRLLVFVSVFMAMLVGLRRFKAYLSPAKEEQTLIEKFKVCTMFSLGMYVLIHGLITFPIDRYGFPVFIVAAVLLPTFPWQRSKPKQTPFKAG